MNKDYKKVLDRLERARLLKKWFFIILIFLIFPASLYYFYQYKTERKIYSFYWGKIESIQSLHKRAGSFYQCKVLLDSGITVDARCEPYQVNKKRVKVIKIQTIGDFYIYEVVHEYSNH